MPARETAIQRGRRAARELHHAIGAQIRIARVAAGLSQRELGRLVWLSHSTIGRIERGATANLAVRQVALLATVLGLKMSVAFYPTGSPVRDAAHLALLGRLRSVLPPTIRFRTEVPMPSPGDLRSADGVIDDPAIDAMVEAETHVDDVQAVIRRARAKRRDLGCRRLILLLSDSQHHRQLVRSHPILRDEFPVSARNALLALRRGEDPGGDVILLR